MQICFYVRKNVPTINTSNEAYFSEQHIQIFKCADNLFICLFRAFFSYFCAVLKEYFGSVGKDFKKLNIAFTSNLGTNAAILAMQGLGYPISIEGAGRYWRSDLLVQKKLYPEITAGTVIAWRRNIPYAQAVLKFIDEINALQA